MKGAFRWILRHRKLVLLLFVAAALGCAYASQLVKVNYNLSDYLPDDAPSTVGLRLMQEEFASEPSNLRVLLLDSSIAQTLNVKARIAAVEGVSDVSWLDDSVDITTPLEMMDEDLLNTWYKDGNALITAYVDQSLAHAALSQIREIIGDENAMSGDIVQTDETRTRSTQEISRILIIAVPLIFIILLFSTTSFLEPALFLITIGVAIILGKGTDLLFGQISFITSACSAILQLATSMDYAIFLLESFEEFRARGLDPQEAMVEAMSKAFSSIFSSSLTTVFGFLALTIMQFKIGFDLGLVLAKGIFLSLICVLALLPVLSISCSRAIERLHHRPLLPRFTRFARVNAHICIPVMLLVALAVVYPAYMANQRLDTVYGTTQMLVDPQLRVVQDQNQIEQLYGKSNQMVLMAPTGQIAREQEMIDQLDSLDGITSVIAYSTQADSTIPVDFVGRENLTQLIGEHYSRIILSADTEVESEQAFELVKSIRAVAQSFYPDENYLTGGASNILDMRDVVIQDNEVVNALTIFLIGVVLLINFKSLLLPVILLSVIKSSVYINLAVPYFTDEKVYYISTLIINAVQLGATVDYAILFTNRYMSNRRQMGRLAAAESSIASTFPSILTSAGILFTGGAILGAMSSVDIIRQLGFLVGRGALISAAMVALVLPALLIVLDPLIRFTTFGTRFYKKKKNGQVRPALPEKG